MQTSPHIMSLDRLPPLTLLLVATLLVGATGCQVVVPSAQRGPDHVAANCAEKVQLGPSASWTRRLPGMPEFEPVGAGTSRPAPAGSHPKFHPVPTRPVFTPWKVGEFAPRETAMENPLHQGQGTERQPQGPANGEEVGPGGFDPNQFDPNQFGRPGAPLSREGGGHQVVSSRVVRRRHADVRAAHYVTEDAGDSAVDGAADVNEADVHEADVDIMGRVRSGRARWADLRVVE